MSVLEVVLNLLASVIPALVIIYRLRSGKCQ